jgi:hypothetical protein
MHQQNDTAILVSSDSDLVPAIVWIRMSPKKRIEYIGISIPDLVDASRSTKPLMMMFQKTDIQRVLSDADMRKLTKPNTDGGLFASVQPSQ